MKRIIATLFSLTSAGAFGATFTVTNTADSGAGSLRQAIMDANANPGLDTIAFNIIGSGVHTISPTSALPTITDPVIIDGYTQPGSAANTLIVGNDATLLIEINGTGLSGDLFLINGGGGSTVRGLVVNGVPGQSFNIQGSNANTIAGNFLGTNPAGTVLLSGLNAIRINGASNTVGGAAPAARNVIAGGTSAFGLAHLVFLENAGIGGNAVVQGNYIGTNAAGTAALISAGTTNGITVSTNDNTIGGSTPGAGNVIVASNLGVFLAGGAGGGFNNIVRGNLIGTNSTGTAALGCFVGIGMSNGGGNNTIGGGATGDGNVISGCVEGIPLGDGATAYTIQGNKIGTDISGTLPIPNSNNGISVGVTGAGGIIGGTNAGEGNTIAFNGGQGVQFQNFNGWRIRGNSIFSNGGLGISFGPLGAGVPTPNDPGDGDTGANDLQNFPIVSSVTILAPQVGTRIQGVLHSAASTTYDLDFYANPACSNFPREFLEGETYLGSSQVSTDGSGTGAFDVTLPVAIQPGQPVTATATDPNGSTSEFSQRLPFSISPTSGPPATATPVTIAGTDFLPSATVTIGGQPATGVSVDSFNSITAQSPLLAAGTVNDVVVSNTDGSAGTLLKGWVSDFLDVPGSQQFYSFVTTLVSNAITVGVGGGLYGVDQPTLRRQMAVFLLKARHGLCYTPPPCTGVFADVACPSTFADWIEALAAESITGGCGGGNYCPSNPVRRDQMAVFLLKAEHGSSYLPPSCAGVFPDVPCPSTFADWIEQLAAENITGGCGGGNYCPLNPNTRGQMAVFITKTFGLQ